MELLREHLEVEVSGPVLGQFQLGINAENFKLAMDILMDLYTDPIGSVVREVGSNARDAMNAVGKYDVPIEVTLPTGLSPYLVIKDRGSGMTKEFLTTTYCKLLSSTKRDDNEGIGGYGIGSKSPLGYTDSYTLSTRVDGEELHIHVSRNGGFTTLGSNPTTEDDGTTVTVPVKGKDCKAFADAVQWLRYMDPPPLINGTPMVKEEVLLEGDNWFIAKDNSPYGTDPCILLGPIPYRLDLNKLGNWSGPARARCVAEARGMRIRFPIGSLTVTPSRETLRYDEHTISVIKDTLLAVYDPALAAIEKMLSACKWEVDARSMCFNYSFNNWWRHSGRTNRYQDSTNLPSGEKWQTFSYNTYKNAVVCESASYYPSGGAEVYLHDKPIRSRMRINAYVTGKNDKNFKLLVGPVDSRVLKENLFPTKLLSTLPDVDGDDDELVYEEGDAKPEKKVLEKLARGSMRAMKWSLTMASPERTLLYTHAVETTMPLNGDGYYLCMSAGKVVHPDVKRDFHAYNVDQMLNIMGIGADQTLYVVSPQSVARLGPGWKELVTSTHEYLTPWLPWIRMLWDAPYPHMSLHNISEDQYHYYGITPGSYLSEYLKLANEASKFTKPKPNTFWSWVLDLYRGHLLALWDDIKSIRNDSLRETLPLRISDWDKDPLTELRYLVTKVYPLVEHFRIEAESMKHYLAIIDANLERGDGWYSSCKLTEGVPSPTMEGRELMIHYYQEHGDVRGYYERYGQ